MPVLGVRTTSHMLSSIMIISIILSCPTMPAAQFQSMVWPRAKPLWPTPMPLTTRSPRPWDFLILKEKWQKCRQPGTFVPTTINRFQSLDHLTTTTSITTDSNGGLVVRPLIIGVVGIEWGKFFCFCHSPTGFLEAYKPKGIVGGVPPPSGTTPPPIPPGYLASGGLLPVEGQSLDASTAS